MPSKQRYVIQTNRTGGATFRIPLDKEASVRDAMQVISTRMSSILQTELRATNVLISKTNLFEEDTLEDVVDASEVLYVELEGVAAEPTTTVGAEGAKRKYIDMSEESQSICSSLLDNNFNDDSRARVASRMQRVDGIDHVRGPGWGFHHMNVRMDPTTQATARDGANRTKPLPCILCVELKRKGDRRTSDCCKECNKPLHRRCHAEYHNSRLQNGGL